MRIQYLKEKNMSRTLLNKVGLLLLNQKIMNNLKTCSFLIFFAAALIFQSCQKEEITPQNEEGISQITPENKKGISQNGTAGLFCTLDDSHNVFQSNFDDHMTEWFGPDDFYTHTSGKPRLSILPIYVGDGGTIEDYVDCGPLQPYYTCCSSVTVFLDPFNNSGSGLGYTSNSWAGFEFWNPIVDADFQDNVFDVEEKQAFIERVEDYAQSLYIPCTGGSLFPTSYNFAWYNSDGKTRVLGVQAIYTPTCFSFPFSPNLQ